MKIEFIIPTYNRPKELRTCLSSLFAQNNPNFTVHVVADAPYQGFKEVMDVFRHEPNLKVSVLNGPHKDWGHTARNYGLDKAEEEWIVMSGDDNYYTPVFVDNFLRATQMDRNVGFVYCDMVHNWVNEEYLHLESKPMTGKIDIGNFMVKRNLIGSIRLDPRHATSDGKFVESYLDENQTIKRIKIKKILYVHN